MFPNPYYLTPEDKIQGFPSSLTIHESFIDSTRIVDK